MSSADRASCKSCSSSVLFRQTPDATKQICQVAALEVVFAIIFLMAGTCFFLMFFVGLYGRFPIADVSEEGYQWVITTSLAHFLLKRTWVHPHVTFQGTQVPALDQAPLHFDFIVNPLNLYQLTLHCHEFMPGLLDTSMGHLHIQFPQAFLVTGWKCPLICWCLLSLAVSLAAAYQLTWSLSLVILGLNVFVAAIAFFLRCRTPAMLKFGCSTSLDLDLPNMSKFTCFFDCVKFGTGAHLRNLKHTHTHTDHYLDACLV